MSLPCTLLLWTSPPSAPQLRVSTAQTWIRGGNNARQMVECLLPSPPQHLPPRLADLGLNPNTITCQACVLGKAQFPGL